jgi:hypothetical protein
MTFWKACLFALMVFYVRKIVDNMEAAEVEVGE